MKRGVVPALGLALLLSLPAVPQEQATLADEVGALKKKVEEQGAALKELQTYVERQKAQAARLARSLAAAEEQGFALPAPNNDARRSLLSGLREFAAVAAGGEPEAAAGEKAGESGEE